MEEAYSAYELLVAALRRLLAEVGATSPNRSIVEAALRCAEAAQLREPALILNNSRADSPLHMAARHLNYLDRSVTRFEERRALAVTRRAMRAILLDGDSRNRAVAGPLTSAGALDPHRSRSVLRFLARQKPEAGSRGCSLRCGIVTMKLSRNSTTEEGALLPRGAIIASSQTPPA